MKKWFVLICCGCLLSLFSAEAQNWQSALVKVKKSGKLVYAKDKDGFVFPDFSHAGYRSGTPCRKSGERNIPSGWR